MMTYTITLSDINVGTYLCTTTIGPVDVTYLISDTTLTN